MAATATAALRFEAAPDPIGALVDSEGSARHRWTRAPELLSGRHATRNLADAAHFLCILHGRHPGVIDLAAVRPCDEAARSWLAAAANGFGDERLFLTRITVAAGPPPSTLGHGGCESAVMGQRQSFETLARSERTGCALGAALALALDWVAIRAVLDRAATRLGVVAPPLGLPDTRETSTVALTVTSDPAIERALGFAAQQVVTQHRRLWDMLEARAAARTDF